MLPESGAEAPAEIADASAPESVRPGVPIWIYTVPIDATALL